MASDGGKSQLPSAPSTLCFNKDEFMKEKFSIDRFVSECRKHVQLETLREDLGLYLRLLRTAMIELINQDYADFVNLSSNLVGLDRAIGKLSVPLGQLKEEVKSVKASVDEAICQIDMKLNQRKQMRDKKTSLQLLMSSVQCVERIESLLGIRDDNSGIELNLDGNLMERIATEYNRLQFVINKSKGLPLIEKLKPRILHITTVLQRNLEASFLSSLNSNDVDGLRQCLRIYATIDKTRDVEDLFRKQIVAPYMELAINETVLKSNPQGLKGMYSKVLEFIPKHCTHLKMITGSTFSGEPVEGFDFLVNSVWPEIVFGMEIRTPVLCDLTNPKAFHERYLTTMEFLEKFEDECQSLVGITRLREHPSYTTFLNKWNLTVYFQIRFQEIAGSLESSLSSSPVTETTTEDKEYFVGQTSSLWNCLHQCWSSDIYLDPLTHRFWKLSLLLLSRYIQWAIDAFNAVLCQEKPSGADPTSSNSIENPAERSVNGVAPKSPSDKSETQTLTFVVALAYDINKLLQNVPVFVNEVIVPSVHTYPINNTEILMDCINEIKTNLAHLLPKLGQLVIDNLSTQCCTNLKSAYDIPRLFRRTNREVPNKPSNYVTTTLKPLQSFLSDHQLLIAASCRHEWVMTIVGGVTVQFLNITLEVLTSVKKMEDSLKRLKKARDKSSTMPVGNSSGITDDDKIRLQLALDVEYFGKQVKLLGINGTDIPSFQALVELVESARSSPGRSS